MNSQHFERAWNGGLRRRLLDRANRFLPAYEAETAVGKVTIALCRRLPELPEEGECGFELARYAFYLTRVYALEQWYRRQRKKRTGQIVPLMVNIEGKPAEHIELQNRAKENFREAERLRGVQADAESILRLARNEGDRKLLTLLAAGYNQLDAATALGVSRQAVNIRVGKIRQRALMGTQESV